jgi:hypothetical protein
MLCLLGLDALLLRSALSFRLVYLTPKHETFPTCALGSQTPGFFNLFVCLVFLHANSRQSTQRIEHGSLAAIWQAQFCWKEEQRLECREIARDLPIAHDLLSLPATLSLILFSFATTSLLSTSQPSRERTLKN